MCDASLQGPAGAKGAPGETGSPGSNGGNGDPGRAGAPGGPGNPVSPTVISAGRFSPLMIDAEMTSFLIPPPFPFRK